MSDDVTAYRMMTRDEILARSRSIEENFKKLKQRCNSLEEINKEMMDIFLWVHREIEFWSVPMMRKELNQKLRDLNEKYKIRN